MGTSPSSPTFESDEKFWVPPQVIDKKRAQSLTPSLLQHSSSTEDINAVNDTGNASPVPSLREAPFHFSHDLLSRGSMGMSVDIPSNPPPAANQRRRASMHDAIDHTKIDTKLYDKMLLRQQSVSSIQEENLGSLNLSLELNTETSLLSVRLIQARDLLAVDSNALLHPYCRVTLLPQHGTQIMSRIHRNTLNPEFEEEFLFDIINDDYASRTLQVLIFHYDQYSRDECIGEVQIKLEEVDFSEKAILWRGIMPRERDDENRRLGDVMFSLAYLSSAERLTVNLTKARHLKFHADPYVKITLLQQGKKLKKKKTSTQHNTGTPMWNEALTFGLSKSLLPTVQLELAIYHDNKLGADVPLGKVLLSSNQNDKDTCSHWKELVASHNTSARWHSLKPL